METLTLNSIGKFFAELETLDLFLVVKNGDLILNGHKGKLSSKDIASIKQNDHLINYIKENKALLVDYLSKHGGSQQSKVEKIGAIYELSPLQEGMLFHHLYDQQSKSYIKQYFLELPGDLNVNHFETAWNHLLKCHSILRTGFVSDKLSIPVQCVYNEVKIPFQVFDWSNLSTLEVERRRSEFIDMDLEKGFDLDQPPLMRLSLIKTSKDSYNLVWTFHHIIIDGWSLPNIFNTVLGTYEILVSGQQAKVEREDKYEDYIKYIKNKTPKDSERFWKAYLKGFITPALLPFTSQQEDRNSGLGQFKQQVLQLDAITEEIKEYAQSHHLTVNTLFQGVWSLLLSKYTGLKDVLFGVTVSGRPADLPFAEDRVGLFINTIPLRTQFEKKQKVSDYLESIQKEHTQARAYQHTALNQIQNISNIRETFFDSIMVYENYPVEKEVPQESKLQMENAQSQEGTNYLLSIVVEQRENLEVKFKYNSSLLSDELVEKIKRHFEVVFDQILTGTTLVSELEFLTAAEKQTLLVDFNDTKKEYPRAANLVSLFEEKVAQYPDHTAINFENTSLSYTQLNESANQLAHFIKANYEIETEDLVGIKIDRSEWMAIGILGILKTGAAYLPIDPDYPQSRIDYILEDSNCKLVIDEALLSKFNSEKTQYSNANLDIEVSAQQLAYVIYTSGSTGQPKGCMLEHRSVVNYLLAQVEEFGINSSENILHLANISFDPSVEQLFLGLLTGAQVTILSKSAILESGKISQVISEQEITHVHMVPSLLQILEYKAYPKLKRVISAGEACRIDLANIWSKGYDFYNKYGPTEATISCLEYKYEANENLENNIPIGFPIANTIIDIVDETGDLVPVGVVGEICIGGAGLARGYLNREALTKEKFVPNPNRDGARMYKTGDLGRWLKNGSVEFVGRKDTQVKIRGHRIELGEIEQVLLSNDQLKEVVVMARKQEEGGKYLVAYVVAEDALDKASLRQYLETKLPTYMIPLVYVELDQLPQNAHGKIDRNALPAPQSEQLKAKKNYVAPRNECEQTLVDIWSKLLRVQDLGIHDNFFELGGDSILSIQVVGRAKKVGFHFSPKDLFTNPTIAGLSEQVIGSTKTIEAEQGYLTGEVDLLPIQSAFFEKPFVEKSHFNQSVLLEVSKDISTEHLEQIVQALVQQHDALRFTYTQTGRTWTQAYSDQKASLTLIDLEEVKEANLSTALSNECTVFQTNLNIENGEVFKAVLFKTHQSIAKNRLFLVAHHLCVDTVSWRIILEQLEQGLQALQTGKQINLGAKSSSYRQWLDFLKKYALSEQVEQQLNYWAATQKDYEPLPTDLNARPVLTGIQAEESITLSKDLTQHLLKDINSVYNTKINDFLLGALLQTFSKWAQQSKLIVGFEGHGREDLNNILDFSQTVGWFTNKYPLALNMPNSGNQRDLILSVKEAVRAVPTNGMAYGLLRYLHPSQEVRQKLQGGKWDILFNYLGQFNDTLEEEGAFKMAEESTGADVSEHYPRDTKFVVNSLIVDGQLNLTFNYSTTDYEEATVKHLAKQYLDNLTALIKHCQEKTTKELSPSDYGLCPDVSVEALDNFLNFKENGSQRRDQISSLYRLGAMQEGILFNDLFDSTSKVYVEQSGFDFQESVNLQALQDAFQFLLQTHSILRTAFFAEELSIPVQCVYQDIKMPIEVVDLSDLSPADQLHALDDFMKSDLDRGFDFTAAPLMRATLIQLAENSCKLVWTHHHILWDGWSAPILVEELLGAYELFAKGTQPSSTTEDNYEEYIQYLNSRDKFAEQTFWQNYLADLEEPSLLPETSDKVAPPEAKSINIVFDSRFTQKIRKFVQSNHITANTLIQGIWSILLSSYTGRLDTVFGAVVSGRPEALRNAEDRVGLFINTLPIRSGLKVDHNLQDWLKQLQEEHTQARDFQYTPLNKVQKWSGIPGDLFNSILVFQNYPVGEELQDDWSFNAHAAEEKEQSHYALTMIAGLGKNLALKLNYDNQILSDQFIVQVKKHFESIINQVVIEGVNDLQSLALVSPEEKKQLLTDFVPKPYDFPKDQSIVDLFEYHVLKNPNQPALVFNGQALSYAELNAKANRVAHYLIAKGIKKEGLIGICLERSVEMIIGVLGILKAGGAYVPLDPNYPQSRIDFIVEDIEADLIITNTDQSNLFASHDLDLLLMDQQETILAEASTENPNLDISSHHLAYVIYTSGSTGKPKGVMIEQYSVARLIFNEDLSFLNEKSILYQYAPMSFDASTFEVWGSLLRGGQLVISDPGMQSLEAISQVVKQEGVNVLWMTTALFHLAVDNCIDLFSTVDYIISGGEFVKPDNIQKVLETYEGVKFINAYGPTESTTFTTLREFTDTSELVSDINNVGPPISNTQIYLLHSDTQQLVPPGMIGELCIGGAGLARGYLNNEILTQQKFVDHPFEAGQKIYKTGDLARWLPNGDIAFIGRKDDQVKIRGFRIELGEIENVLKHSPIVNQCVVLVHIGEDGSKRLIAYIQSSEFNRTAIQDYLKDQLPDYMIPGIILEIESFPLNINGKIDKKALPKPDLKALSAKHFVAPRNETEAQLAKIWAELLHLEQVSVEDNFFELGGDSIITIQVVSRAKRLGFQISPRHLFEYPTIANLAAIVQDQTQNILAEQGALHGQASLLPIQQWYFETPYEHKSHFNQSMLLNLNKEIRPEQLQEAIDLLMKQHDALGFNYTQTNEEWTQVYGQAEALIETLDFQNVSAEELEANILKECENYQTSLSIEKGELVKAVWINTPSNEPFNRLFLVVHHLAIDGVSWRILLEQLELILTALQEGEAIDLGQKSSSYRQWAEALNELAQSPKITADLPYWKKVISNYQALPVDNPVEQATVQTSHGLSFSLDENATQALLKEANQTYNTEINDVLLSALALTIQEWTGEERINIGLEGHGREDLFPELDTSNTIGWFTTLYPISLKAAPDYSLGDLIKSTKETLRSVPGKGISFGLLRYLSEQVNTKDDLKAANWDIIFNYLGQFDNISQSPKWFSIAEEDTGSSVNNSYPMDNKFAVSGFIADGKLTFSWTYSTAVYEQTTIEQLIQQFEQNLGQLIEHCQSKAISEKTPSDYGLGNIVGFKELDNFLHFSDEAGIRKDLISAVYPLSPMQEGMLFHYLLDESSNAYTEQLEFDFPEGLNLELFESAWNLVLNQHSILRTGFVSDEMSSPVQIVYKEANIPIEIIDFSQLDESEQAIQIKAYQTQQLQKRFDMAKAPLMSVNLIKIAEDEFKMLWTYHHILLDGWSMPILIDELMSNYQLLEQGENPISNKEDVYEEYIKYIQSRDKFEEDAFWKEYLSNLEEPGLLPFNGSAQSLGDDSGARDYNLLFSEEQTQQIKTYAKEKGLTVNTICQGIWAFLLAKYTAKDEAIYGVTVSGRPTEIEGSEQKVGLYINTLPFYANLEQDQRWSNWLLDLQNGHTKAREYQYSSLTSIQSLVNVTGELFDSLLVFENYPSGEALSGGDLVKVEEEEAKAKTNYPLAIVASLEDQLKLNFNYNDHQIEGTYVQMISQHFEMLVLQFLQNESLLLSEIDILTEEERQLLLNDFDNSKVAYPKEKTIVSLFEDQVLKTPNNIALTLGEVAVTYQDLNERSNQLAHYLLSQGLQKEDLVAICLERSVDMIIGLLAILKAGGAYVPIDPQYPQNRIDYIIQDAQTPFIICDTQSTAIFERETASVIVCMEEGAAYSKAAKSNPDVDLTPQNLAYVIYTSGTTGKPKGVLLEHENIVRLFETDSPLFDFNEKDVWTMFHSFCFDFSVWEMYGALLYGGRLVIIPRSIAKDATAFANLLLKEKVSVLNQTPSAFYTLMDQMPENIEELSIRYVIFGGEALNPMLLAGMKAQYPDCKLINMYGITETTVHVTFKEITLDDTSNTCSNIGQPIPTLSCYVLDSNQHLVPIGVAGELYVGGAGLARGYLNRPALTADRFVENPLNSGSEKLYKTGDLARWLPNGDLEYLGRIDDQVKIRGYRIELGEIGMTLQKAPAVNQGIVMAKPDASGQNRLVAYVVPEEDFDKAKVLVYLKSKLPDYMVPQLFVLLENMPLTSNGKVDKKALPNPDASALISTEYLAPRTELEEQLVLIWKELLRVEKVGVLDNFFELGGHSLLATRLMYLVRRDLEINVPLRIFFQYTTVEDLAKYIKVAKAQETESEEDFEVMEL